MIFQDLEFPIQGPLREPLLIMEWFIVFFFLQWAIIFLMRVISMRKKIRSLQERAYVSLFLGHSTMWIFYIIADYYAETMDIRYLFINFGDITQFVSVFFFIYILERNKLFFRTKFFFSKLYIIMICLFFIVFFINIEYSQVISAVFWLLLLLFFISYLKNFIKMMRSKAKETRVLKEFLKFFVGFFFMSLGFVFTQDFMLRLFGLEIRLIGDFFQILSVIFISYFFITTLPLADYDWQDKVESLFLMETSGICLFNHLFQQEGQERAIMDENLVIGAIASVKIMLDEVIDKKGTSIIQKKDKTVIITSKKNFSGVLFCKERLHSLEVLLDNFTERVEDLYHPIMKNWSGDISVFKSVEIIRKEIFFGLS